MSLFIGLHVIFDPILGVLRSKVLTYEIHETAFG
jgi:hypothetical protein